MQTNGWNGPPFNNLNFLGGMDQDQVLLGRAPLVDHEFQFELGPPPDHGLEVDFGPNPVGENVKDFISLFEVEKGEKEDSPSLGLRMKGICYRQHKDNYGRSPSAMTSVCDREGDMSIRAGGR